MSFLSRLFGSRGGSSTPKNVDALLEKLEAEAENARPGYVGSAYNRAGDLALKDEQTDRALRYYGRAIDAFLEDAQREAARGVANKIIRVRPTAVRTLCTLTWLDLAAGHQAMALLHLRDYASAANDADEQLRAATQVYKMAELADAAEFVDAAADALDSLDFGNRAKEVRAWAKAGAPDANQTRTELAEACLRAAVASNDPDAEMLDDEVGSPAVESDVDSEGDPDAASDREEPTGDSSDGMVDEVEAVADEPEPADEAELADEAEPAVEPVSSVEPRSDEEAAVAEVAEPTDEAGPAEEAGAAEAAEEVEVTEESDPGPESESEGPAEDSEEAGGERVAAEDDVAPAPEPSGSRPGERRSKGGSRKGRKKKNKKKR